MVASDPIIASCVLKPPAFLDSSQFVIYDASSCARTAAACEGNAAAAEAQQQGQRMTSCCECKVQRADKQSPADLILLLSACLVKSHNALNMPPPHVTFVLQLG